MMHPKRYSRGPRRQRFGVSRDQVPEPNDGTAKPALVFHDRVKDVAAGDAREVVAPDPNGDGDFTDAKSVTTPRSRVVESRPQVWVARARFRSSERCLGDRVPGRVRIQYTRIGQTM